MTHGETTEDVSFKVGYIIYCLYDEPLTKLSNKPRRINIMFTGGGKSHLHLIGYRSSADHRTYWIRLEIDFSGQKGVDSGT
jgi:hypothetical protein